MFSVHYYKNLANSKGVVWSSKMKTLLRAKRGTEFQGQPSIILFPKTMILILNNFNIMCILHICFEWLVSKSISSLSEQTNKGKKGLPLR